MKKNGFSLLEVVLSIGIIALIGVFASTLLTRTYKSTASSDLSSRLKQNGENASHRISESLRMADAVVCYGGDNLNQDNRIVFLTSEGKYDQYRFVQPVIVGSQVTQNGYIAKQENLPPSQLDTFCTQDPTPAQEIIMTDNNLSNGVSVANGEFVKLSGGEGRDTVTIKFDISPAASLSTSFDTVNIQTTVQVR